MYVSSLLLSLENMCGTGLFNKVLNETWTHSCFQYKWFLSGQTGLYKVLVSSFLECVYFGLLYPTLIFDMFIVVCVCVCCRWSVLGFHQQLFCVCVCKCVSWGVLWFLNLLVRLSPFFVYVYICLCMCVCVCFEFFSFICEHVWHKVS